jgi:hypothetical protein
MCSAMALEASLPDWMTMPRRMSITVAWLFSGRYMHDSVLEPRHQAFSLTDTRSSFLSLPERSACSTRKLVIILVSDAGGSASSGLAEASTSPESKSISSQALAASAGGPPATAVCPASGAAAGAAAAFFEVAGLAAWVAASGAAPGTRAPVAMAKASGRMEEVLNCMGVWERNGDFDRSSGSECALEERKTKRKFGNQVRTGRMRVRTRLCGPGAIC